MNWQCFGKTLGKVRRENELLAAEFVYVQAGSAYQFMCGSSSGPASLLCIKEVRIVPHFVSLTISFATHLLCPTHAWGSGAPLNQRMIIKDTVGC